MQLSEIVAVSSSMRQVLRTADRLAKSDAPVLISGESGTGKELVARRIHTRGPRAENAFVTMNCTGTCGPLRESPFFGHEHGAHHARAGRFREAERGTLFLDQVADLPPPLQRQLLGLLRERSFDVVDSDQALAVNVRVIAATNRTLEKLVEAGAFRQDLFYRLNVVELAIPPLRRRVEDIEALSRHFVRRAAPGRDLLLGDDVLDALRRYEWPGNVRELENACKRLVILCEGDTLSLRDLPPSVVAGDKAICSDPGEPRPVLGPEGLSLIDLERRVVERALLLKGGNIAQSAAFLRIPRNALAYRMEKYGLRRTR